MKLVLKRPERLLDERISIYQKEQPCLDSSWHYHPQYEILYVSKSSGIRFVGDSVSQFSPGDLVLVGSNLPHLWRNDPSYYKPESTIGVKTVVIKFLKNFIGRETFSYPEFSSINHLLEESKYGLSFGRNVSKSLHHDLLSIVNKNPIEQSLSLVSILNNLSLAEDKEVLSTTDMRQVVSDSTNRLDSVLKYISDNYADKIQLKDVASVACMTTNSFCRFFKRMTNKSFTQFLNEVRIKNACRLLVEDEYSLTQICYMVGYNCITNFYKQFKLIMECTPNDYRHNY